MDMQQIIEQAEQNIRQALKDYGVHTPETEVLSEVSDKFIRILAKDSSYAKQELRELFSKSPVWDERIDALVINGTRTHDTDYTRISSLARQILYEPLSKHDEKFRSITQAIEFFSSPELDEAKRAECIEAINTLAPKAYAPTKKPSRVFKALCKAIGVADETAGSSFQRLFAQFADELTSKKISFKLYVSINPAHFLTMSNPKGDSRGETLTSCHSFNSLQYQYNSGCTGYARDKISFIVFTVADTKDPETLNNRKTTRQVFAYRPNSGLLLQSRMYNTSGGTRGAQTDSKLYRDLVQREISMLENAPNLWRTFDSTGDKSRWVNEGRGFGGYADWNYDEFDGHISFRNDFNEQSCEPLAVGTYGLCICCGNETSEGLYCNSCKEGCEECGARNVELTIAYDENGNEISLCNECLNRYYSYCDECGRYHHINNVSYIEDRNVCNDCKDVYYERCENCRNWYRREDMYYVHTDSIDSEGYVCERCFDDYCCCDECEEDYPEYTMYTAYGANGNRIILCESCHDNFETCPQCNELIETCDDGTCPACGAVIKD